jgi:hypothetical protein
LHGTEILSWNNGMLPSQYSIIPIFHFARILAFCFWLGQVRQALTGKKRNERNPVNGYNISILEF